MLMGKQMVLAVLIIAVAFGTVPEFQIRIIQFRSSADRTLMFCPVGIILSAAPGHCFSEVVLPFSLPRIVPFIIPRGKEENDRARQRKDDRHLGNQISAEEIDCHDHRIEDGHIFHLHRDQKVQHDLHVREAHRKPEENG